MSDPFNYQRVSEVLFASNAMRFDSCTSASASRYSSISSCLRCRSSLALRRLENSSRPSGVMLSSTARISQKQDTLSMHS